VTAGCGHARLTEREDDDVVGTSSPGQLWGTQTARAIENVGRIAGPLPRDLIQAVAAIKVEAAMVNARLDVIASDVADAIVDAGNEVLEGRYSDQFPVDVFQTGSGTSTNMNVNEVLARLATERSGIAVHPNDHVNASQSSNDVFPSAIRIAALRRLHRLLLPALERLHGHLLQLADAHARTVKLGRTHLMDAVPMTFGQEAGGWARAVELTLPALETAALRLHELALGGTAVGTGLNAPPAFGSEVAQRLARRFDLPLREAADHFESQGGQEALGALSGACRTTALTLNKIAGDLRLLGSGPASGLGEIDVPNLQAGSSIMPGKVNPVILEVVHQLVAQVVGNDAAITFASTNATLQLTTAMPVMARNVLSNLSFCGRGADLLGDKGIALLEVNAPRMRDHALRSPSLVTALAPYIGYDRAAVIARTMLDHRLTIEEAGRHELGDEAWEKLASFVELETMARPGIGRPDTEPHDPNGPS
jgi:fumarate hydratase class II